MSRALQGPPASRPELSEDSAKAVARRCAGSGLADGGRPRRRTWRVSAAAALTIVGAAGTFVAGGWLAIDAGRALAGQAADKVCVEGLTARVYQEARFAAELQAELDRQTVVALARDARKPVLAWALLVCAALTVVGAKWFVSARALRPAVPRRVVNLHRRALAVANPGDAREVAVQAGALALPVLHTPEVDLQAVDEIIARVGGDSAAAIPILQEVQRHYRYLPDAVLKRVCALTDITPGQIAGVASFYSHFRRTPVGEHVVTVCHGTACHVAGAPQITEELRRRLGVPAGTDTDAAGRFTVEQVPCMGCCTLAPVVRIDEVTHGHTRADSVGLLLEQPPRGRGAKGPSGRANGTSGGKKRPGDSVLPADGEIAGEIRIGLGSCCVANGSGAVHDALERALAEHGACVRVKRVGCVGMCHNTPFLEIRKHGLADDSVTERAGRNGEDGAVLYSRVSAEQVAAIVRRHFGVRGLLPRARRVWQQAASAARSWNRNGRAAVAAPAAPQALELRDPPIAAFLGRQKHIATEHCGSLDPLDLDEYIAHGGFAAWQRITSEPMPPVAVIEEVRQSGLRGRGGAGYPTWLKWNKVTERRAATKYVICNGDEGDPGAFMDRMLMESYPYRIIEGLMIAAYAVGATEGVFYIRAEYPLACERLTAAIRKCEQRGLLRPDGRLEPDSPEHDRHMDIRGGLAARTLGDADTGPSRAQPGLTLRVVQGAGAFVCGEETALIASLQGQRGTPRLRPPYPAEKGLWGRPTLVNNVETLACVPWILRNGPAAFAALGTERSKGTKVFALAGKVARGGLIEVPMGITIREIVEEIGGGGKRVSSFDFRVSSSESKLATSWKAVQIGGPSGGCVPAALADTPVDFEDLAQVGAIMGSGGLVVLDETDCMVDLARYFLEFTQGQSCGKCVPCRVGTRRMLEILERICAGQGRTEDLPNLEELARGIQATSLCGLGKTAPNPVLTTLRYFRDEYEAHLAGRCPAGKCKALIEYVVNEACTGCTICAQYCPVGAIELRPYERHEVDTEKCTRCDVCRARCPEGAIDIMSGSCVCPA
ncbi:MAG: NAD(P)H-dependent oxidoreductase subunit E [Planctomycetota bacterium]